MLAQLCRGSPSSTPSATCRSPSSTPTSRPRCCAGRTARPFLTAIVDSVVVTLYSDPEVWELLGYEGPSFDKGGYLHRGFDDLDWLPDPPIEHEEEMTA